MVLWNPPTSNTKVYIKNMKVINEMSQDNALGTSILNYVRISAYITNNFTNSAQYIVPMNSSNPSLPSQVKILTRVDSVTTTGIIKEFMNFPQNGDTIVQARTIAIRTSKSKGLDRRGLNPASISYSYGTTATGQKLREGEGVAIVANGIQVNVAYRFTITMTTDNGYTYMATEVVRPYSTFVPFVVFNGSGSGVVLTINNVECEEMGVDSLCQFAIQKIDDIFLGSDEVDVTSTIFEMDSSNTLPTAIKCYTNCLVELHGVKYGGVTVAPTFRKNSQMWIGTGPTWAIGARMYGIVTSSELIDNGTAPIILRPGEGIALMQKNASEVGRYEATILFQTESLATGSGPKATSFVT